jgi:secondary thiamine-phosphate synthase enzyme
MSGLATTRIGSSLRAVARSARISTATGIGHGRSGTLGRMQSIELTIDTTNRRIVNLTPQVAAFCASLGDGLVNVFAPHATVGLALIELGSGSDADLELALDRLLPRNDRLYRHRHGTPGHGADHVVPAFLCPSLVIPVFRGKPELGTWQSIALVDLNVDNPVRQVRLSYIAG